MTKPQVLISSVQMQLELSQIITDKTCEFQVILPSRNFGLSLTQNAQAFAALDNRALHYKKFPREEPIYLAFLHKGEILSPHSSLLLYSSFSLIPF